MFRLKLFFNFIFRACGHSYQLDMRHKLTTFILKNPPGTKLNDTGTSLTERKDKKSKRKQDEETNGGICFLTTINY